jgi:hypothetical protein
LKLKMAKYARNKISGSANIFEGGRAGPLCLALTILLVGTLSGCATGQLKAPCGPLNHTAVKAYDTPQNEPCGEAKPVNAAFSTLLKR